MNDKIKIVLELSFMLAAVALIILTMIVIVRIFVPRDTAANYRALCSPSVGHSLADCKIDKH